ncbi:TonB-dependent receptor plug domain-containing protein [Microbulbifer pacificus]|uniref:TonB-dependent receptor n=1 Tax=Microbulbifer pacificus TaxID=407164 RepID=A0AAU0MYF7_9GAMM|nr:TonB-dependent receptor [Microbulbifer pacificus]WOX05133.1 TonB-dependent receptor [Microbulbifer pacificus]
MANPQDLENDKLSDKTLVRLLHRFQESGYKIIFSDNLVPDSLLVLSNPEPGEPIARLRKALLPHNLTLKHQDNIDTWYVVAGKTNFRSIKVITRDIETNAPIKGVEVNATYLKESVQSDLYFSGNSGSKSDKDGAIQVTLNIEDILCLQFHHQDYRDRCLPAAEPSGEVYVNLKKRNASIEEVVVTSNFHFENSTRSNSPQTFESPELHAAPTLGGDSLQVIHSVPGVASQGFSAKPNIRGGADDEMLVLFDDIELIDPFHLKDYQSLLSGISPEIVDSLSIYTGGYPARFGGKMSGVMDIRSPEEIDEFRHSVSVNPFSTTVQWQGNVPQNETHWNIVARQGILDESLEQVNEEIGTPQFSDIYASARWKISPEIDAEAAYLSMRDDIELLGLHGDEGESMHSIYDSKYGWIKTSIQHTPNFSSKHILTIGDIYNRRNGYINEPDVFSKSIGSLSDRRRFKIARFENHVNYEISEEQVLNGGLRLEHLKGYYDYGLSVERGLLSALLGSAQKIDSHVEASPEGTAGSAYFTYRYLPSESWSFEGGLRFDAQNYYSDYQKQVSPRTAVKVRLTDSIQAKMNIGRFYQAPGITDLDVESGEPTFFEPQRSDHFILGAAFEGPKDLTITIEAYRKDVNSPRPRYENAFQPYGYLPELAADRILIKPARSEILGHETLIEYTPSNNFRAWLSYSRSHARDLLESNNTIPRRWNQNNAFQGGLTWINDNWTFSGRGHWHSGWKTTAVPDQITTLEESEPFQIYNTNLPAYFSFDMKISYLWEKPIGELEAYLEVTNLTNRANIGAYELRSTPSSDNNSFEISALEKPLLPIIPSLGFTLRF